METDDAEVVYVEIGELWGHVGERQTAVVEFAAIERAKAAPLGNTGGARIEKVKNLLTQAGERKSLGMCRSAG